MRLLVTAGNTQSPIDRVRCITNIFTGRTGAAIAMAAHSKGHHVTLLTSRPEALQDPQLEVERIDHEWGIIRFDTFENLEKLMAQELSGGGYHAVVHSAAVNDYLAAGIFAPAAGTKFLDRENSWQGNPPRLVNRAANKVKSNDEELWLRMVRAPKLVDRVRTQWSFRGTLVKFKLEVGVSRDELLDIAERSRRQSEADLMVANTLEGAQQWAWLGPLDGAYEQVTRQELPEKLLAAIERLHQGGKHG